MPFFDCPNCKEELEAVIDHEIVDHDDSCEHCGHKFTPNEVLDIYSSVMEDNLSSRIDYAMDYGRDR